MAFSKPATPQSRPPCGLPSDNPSESFWHSEPSPILTAHRTTRHLPKTADVVIVGSGMTGASVAHHLLNDDNRPSGSLGNGNEDLSIVMLEAREACWGATGRNGGHCQPVLFAHPHDPSIGHFELENFRTLRSIIEAKKIDCEFVVQPGVRTFYSRRLWNEVELALLTVQQTDPELGKLMRPVTDKAELAKLRVPNAVGAVVTKIAARMWPYKFVSRILEDLVMATDLKGSFNLQTFTSVKGLVENDDEGWTVNTSRGAIKASKVVLATNAYTSALLPNFADLIVPVRGQMSSLVPWPSVKEDTRLKTSFGFDGEAIDEYLIQRPNERGGHLMYGGGRQIGGATVGVSDDSVIDTEIAKYLRQSLVERLALPESHKMKTREGKEVCENCSKVNTRYESDGLPKRTTLCTFCGQKLRSSMLQYMTRKSPKEEAPELTASHEWTGIMGYSRDEHPWVGAVPGKKNLFMSAGYTGHGMPNTWLCGKAVVETVMKELLLPKLSQGKLPASEDVPTGGLARTRLASMNMFCKVALSAVGKKKIEVPDSYLITEERIRNAIAEREDVGVVDWAEMERGRRQQRADRMPSGYA